MGNLLATAAFAWAGTIDGLNRYDGLFRTCPPDSCKTILDVFWVLHGSGAVEVFDEEGVIQRTDSLTVERLPDSIAR